jgi:hypothetical protein
MEKRIDYDYDNDNENNRGSVKQEVAHCHGP